jgi:hypothetical protein
VGCDEGGRACGVEGFVSHCEKKVMRIPCLMARTRAASHGLGRGNLVDKVTRALDVVVAAVERVWQDLLREFKERIEVRTKFSFV